MKAALLLPAAACSLASCSSAPPQRHAEPLAATYSIVAVDKDKGECGVAVQSKFFSVGTVVPWAEAGVGAVATQSAANITFGREGLRLMKAGKSPEEALREMLAGDPGRDTRQVALIAVNGGAAIHTGAACHAFAGHRYGDGFCVQGNLLAGPEVLAAMAEAFATIKGTDLAGRLVAALQAGEDAGGDSRGRQSAALLVVRKGGGYAGVEDRFIDLRVDDHPDPTAELARLLKIHRQFFADRYRGQ